MPKRHREDEDSDEYIRRKMRKIEKKLSRRKKRSRRISSSTSSSVSPVAITPEPSRNEDAPDVPLSEETQEIGEIIAGPSSIEKPVEDVIDLDELDGDILDLLGDTPSKDKKYGPKIQKDLAIRWEHLATSGLSKESRKELIEKHLTPENCKKIYAPTLNPEIKAALSDLLIKKDKAIESKQKQLAAAISCLAEALTRSFLLEHKDSTVIKLMIEAGRLMCDTQHTESMTRRSFICSSIKKEVKDQLYETEIDQFLFGEKLAETLKAAKAISRSGSEIKIPQSAKTPAKGRTSRGLNFKAPLPNSRQPAVATSRRQEPAQAAAAPTRRQQGPPAPPPPQQQQQPPQQRSRNRVQTRQ